MEHFVWVLGLFLGALLSNNLIYPVDAVLEENIASAKQIPLPGSDSDDDLVTIGQDIGSISQSLQFVVNPEKLPKRRKKVGKGRRRLEPPTPLSPKSTAQMSPTPPVNPPKSEIFPSFHAHSKLSTFDFDVRLFETEILPSKNSAPEISSAWSTSSGATEPESESESETKDGIKVQFVDFLNAVKLNRKVHSKKVTERYANILKESQVAIDRFEKIEKANEINLQQLPVLSKHFKEIEKVGDGSFGIVFKGFARFDRKTTVAIKLAKRKTEDNVPPLLQEAKNLLLLNIDTFPKYVPKFFGYGAYWYDGELYEAIAMEYLGITILDLMRYYYALHESHLPIEVIAEIMVQSLDAIYALHTANFLHRDIKPENFLIGERDGKLVVLLSDFGLTQAVNLENFKNSGSPEYMSVEVHEGQKPTPQGDLESLNYSGIFMYHLKLPWTGLNYILAVYIAKKNFNAEIIRPKLAGEKSKYRVHKMFKESLEAVVLQKQQCDQEVPYETCRAQYQLFTNECDLNNWLRKIFVD